MMHNICIVGSGNISHALIAYLGKNKKNKVNVLSNSLSEKTNKIDGILNDKEKITGKIYKISSNPNYVIPGSDIVLIAVPAFARKRIIKRIKHLVNKDMIIGALPGIGGFNEEIESELNIKGLTYFSSQRVPCIARIIEKGLSVKLYWKEEMFIAVNNNKEYVRNILEEMFEHKVLILEDFLEVNLSNSNPILHSARLYSLLMKSNGGVFKNKILFYEDWDEYSSDVLLRMDEEFMTMISYFRLRNIKSLKEHYGVEDKEMMTKKIRSIDAFKGIMTPMVKNREGYVFDYNSRYFTEDILIGLKYIIEKANKISIDLPLIKEVYSKLKFNIE